MLDQLLDYLNIKELYPPQKEAMQVIERNESLLMSVPTAAGKTVVAYNALMKAVKEGKKGIFLVPLRALAWEKVNELKDICRNIETGCAQTFRKARKTSDGIKTGFFQSPDSGLSPDFEVNYPVFPGPTF